MKTKIVLGLAAALALSSPAFAHPTLKVAGPVPGSVIKTAPKSIRIQFSEGIELSFSGITLKNAKGEAATLGTATLDAKKTLLSVPVTGTLAPGKYTVEWHALGDDTHAVKGQFNFELKP